MHLRAVELRDWRCYRHARFEFPEPEGRRNVILIRGPNEHGKTSFFEAVTLGLFGRSGLPLVPRVRVATNGDRPERIATPYSRFLSAVLHRRAIAQGRQSCSVLLEFDAEGESIEISRTWHFAANGEHKPYDDDLRIFEGAGRRVVAPPAAVTDRDAWYRDFIAQTFIPSTLAEFFLFDGEQIQRYARREMAAQVRSGIEGLLGLPILKSLKDSLLRYGQNRRTSAAGTSDEKVRAVEAEIRRIESEIAEVSGLLENSTSRLPDLEEESEHLLQRLASTGEATMARVGELVQEEDQLRSQASRAADALVALLAGDVALALAGSVLRGELLGRLRAEEMREAWEAGRNQGNANLARYVADLERRLDAVSPSLFEGQRTAVIESVREAWHALWHPPPDGCAADYLHSALMGTTRAQVIQRIDEVASRSVGDVSDLVTTFQTCLSEADAKKRERLRLEQNAPEAERLSARLRDVSEEIGRLRKQRDDAQRTKEALEGDLAAKRQELGRYTDAIGRGKPALRRAKLAEEVARLIDDILLDAVPTQAEEVAAAMTRAWKSMAHMADRVDRIEITADCKVRMLNRRGEDLHEIEKSAGASQVFTQALIWALTRVSGQDFPFIVDTPLARLSHDQRLGVLRTFTDRPGQVVLLSTDEEVVDDKLDAIRDRILVAYQLRVQHEDGVSVTTLEKEIL